MPACTNHPTIAAHETCARCGLPFCDSCLVELLGARYCGPCRDARMAEMQGAVGGAGPFSGTGTVDIGRWLNAGAQIVQGNLIAFALAALLTVVLSGVTCMVCFGPMLAGLYLMSFRQMTYGQSDAGNVFDGFRRFLWAFLTFLLLFLISRLLQYAISLPLSLMGLFASAAVNQRGIGELVALPFSLTASILSIVVNAVVGGATFFAMPHVAARNANPVEAIAASFEVFRRNPLMFILTAFLFGLIMVAGVAAFCVGFLFTLPLIVAATAQAYADHFGIQGFDLV